MKKAFIQMCKKIFPRPLRERGEGKISFAKQTEKTLVPQYLSALVPSKCAAFTLAEVLITLGVIGVVAALTLPTLISNHNKKVWAKGLAKAYSATSQACRMALAQDGVDSYWDTGDGQEMLSTGHGYRANAFIAKYFQNAEVFTNHSAKIKAHDGTTFWGSPMGNLHTGYLNGLHFPSYSIVLHFDTSDYHSHYGGTGGTMYYLVDANGFNKQPNVIGQDVFAFYLNPDCSLANSTGTSHTHNHDTSVSHIYHCFDNQNEGVTDKCFRKVMQDGWEIKY